MDLALLASVGGFFALRATPVPGGGHQPLERLYAGANAPLTARVDKVAARLAAPERRVAASIAHLGLAARLWSLALGPAALLGRVPDLGPGLLHW
ncbi:ferric iron reductase, partial [Streptomyces californicus]